MRSDSAFYIGTTHKVCEDYAVSRDDIIVVSEGCSSSLNTDIGARIVCECIKQNTERPWMEEKSTMMWANKICTILDIPKECLNVTLLTAYSEDDKIIIKTIGDGNIIIKTKDGIMHVLSMKYARSAPYYMNYTYYKENDKDWENIPDNNYTVEHSTIKDIEEDDSYSIETHPPLPGEVSSMFDIPNCDFSLSRKGNKLYIRKKDVEWVALSSDGLNSFQEKIVTETYSTSEPVWYINVIIQLLKINNTEGKFVQRRMNRFKKTCIKENWYNTDDVSLAILVPGD